MLQETQKELKNSLEITTLRRRAILYNILVLAVCFPTALISGLSGGELWLGLATMLILLLVPVNGFWIFRLWKIFRAPENYRFYKTQLNQPKGGRIRDTIRFTVLLEDEEGRFVADTHSIFGTHSSTLFPSLEDYVNQTVTIAYNDETGEVVVIG